MHITVLDPDMEDFRTICGARGLKLIVIDGQDRAGTSVQQDVMTSSKIMAPFSHLSSAIGHASLDCDALRHAGFNPVRQKVETVPWHPWAPTRSNGLTIPPDRYFEAHIGVVMATPDRTMPDRTMLAWIAKQHGAHVSRNVLKVIQGPPVLMLTLRHNTGTREDFEAAVRALTADLWEAEHVVTKSEIEYALYDSNTQHDAAWINSNREAVRTN